MNSSKGAVIMELFRKYQILAILGVIFIGFSAAQTSANKTIRMGHISAYSTVPVHAAAISLAVEKFQAEGRLPDYKFE